jgi:hypothetical protein
VVKSQDREWPGIETSTEILRLRNFRVNDIFMTGINFSYLGWIQQYWEIRAWLMEELKKLAAD